MNRTSPNVDPSGTMYLINHFLDKTILGNPVPFVEKLNQTNAATGAGSLGAQVDSCVTQYSKPPNFMLVDVRFNHRFYQIDTDSDSSTNLVEVPCLKLLHVSITCNTMRLTASLLQYRLEPNLRPLP